MTIASKEESRGELLGRNAMPEGANAERRQGLWDKGKICAELMIAVAALSFTVTYNRKQAALGDSQEVVAKLNLAVARTQVENSLFLAASSENPKQRSMALYLAEILDKPFAVRLAKVMSSADPSAKVRTDAVSTLRSLSRSDEKDVKSAAQGAVANFDLIAELQLGMQLGQLRGDAQACETYARVFREWPSLITNESDRRIVQEASASCGKGESRKSVARLKQVAESITKPQ
jgi:hypothetical protein